MYGLFQHISSSSRQALWGAPNPNPKICPRRNASGGVCRGLSVDGIACFVTISYPSHMKLDTGKNGHIKTTALRRGLSGAECWLGGGYEVSSKQLSATWKLPENRLNMLPNNIILSIRHLVTYIGNTLTYRYTMYGGNLAPLEYSTGRKTFWTFRSGAGIPASITQLANKGSLAPNPFLKQPLQSVSSVGPLLQGNLQPQYVQFYVVEV